MYLVPPNQLVIPNFNLCMNVFSQFLVRGYTTTKTSLGDVSQQDMMRDLLTQKQALMMELKNFEYNNKYNENLLNETESFENVGAIPANTKLQIALSTVEETQKVSSKTTYNVENNFIYLHKVRLKKIIIGY